VKPSFSADARAVGCVCLTNDARSGTVPLGSVYRVVAVGFGSDLHTAIVA